MKYLIYIAILLNVCSAQVTKTAIVIAWDSASFAGSNPILGNYQFGKETDTKRVKMGDGSTRWNLLGYVNDAEVDSLVYATRHYVDSVASGGGIAYADTLTLIATKYDLDTLTVTATVDSSIYSTHSYIDSAIASNVASLQDSIDNKVSYSDSLTLYTTPAQLKDSIDTKQDELTGNGYVKNTISGISYITSIPNSDLQNSTISGHGLGNDLSTLTLGTGLTGTSYNGSTGVTAKVDTSLLVTVTALKDSITANKTDTTSLSNRINLKVSIADTASMLTNYLRKADTLSLSNRIDTKLTASDTTAMLSTYLRKADTASLSNRINLKVNISDTSSMLANYQLKNVNISSGSFNGSFNGNGGTVALNSTTPALVMPYAMTITGWSITASGSSPTCTIKVWRVATGTTIPTSSNSINTSGISLSTGNSVSSTTLSDFTSTAIASGDRIIFAVTAIANATDIYVTITGTKN